MSINENIDIKEKKLLIHQSVENNKKTEDENKDTNKRFISNTTNTKYQININKINSKEEKINSEEIKKNKKTNMNNYSRTEVGKETNKGLKKLEKPKNENLKPESLNKSKNENTSTKMNNLDKFNLGLQKNNTPNSRNNKIISLNKNFKSDEKKDVDEEQILILNTNKFEYNSNSNNNLNANFITNNSNNNNKNNLNLNEIANFKTIEIDKYNDKLKEIERNKSINNSYSNNSKKIRLDKSNLKDKIPCKEKNEEEEKTSKNRVVNFKGNVLAKKQISKFDLERSKTKELLRSKKTSLSINIFKSKGDANITDKKFKNEQKPVTKIVTNQFMSNKSILIAAENIKVLNKKNYFRNISPIKIQKKDTNEINKQIEFILLRSEKEDKGNSLNILRNYYLRK